jgi:hypothetical protein
MSYASHIKGSNRWILGQGSSLGCLCKQHRGGLCFDLGGPLFFCLHIIVENAIDSMAFRNVYLKLHFLWQSCPERQSLFIITVFIKLLRQLMCGTDVYI